jgi:predicted small metal-binding protein
MTEVAGTPYRSLACRDLGFPCEWAIRSTSDGEVRSRFAAHAKCAHALDPIPPAIAKRLVDALRTWPEPTATARDGNP